MESIELHKALAGDDKLKRVFRDMVHNMLKGCRFLVSIDRINYYSLPGRAILGNAQTSTLAGDDELKGAFHDMVHDMLMGRRFLAPIDGINHYGLPGRAILGKVLEI
ncbi:hypothetical protein NL676_038153 [Syzygium grande]|nr:hypothetical protein NL676_038153 [Syzygium grande]